MKTRIVFFSIVVIINLVSLCFIIALVGYDEISGCVFDAVIKKISGRPLWYLLFITSLLNLYLLLFLIIENSYREKR